MKIILSVCLCFLFTTALGQIDITTTTDASQTTTTEETTTDNTTPTETTPTTVESTAVVSTTTISSTTSSSTTQRSTTIAPTSTSSPASSTTAPEPELEKCEFNVTDGNNTCIRADLKAKFIINAEGNQHTIVPVCNRTSVTGDCSSNETQTLVVSESTYILTMLFEKKSGKVLVNNITLNYSLPGIPRGFGSNNTEDLFDVKAGNSYLCKSKLDIHLENITMEVSEVHIQAFIEGGESFGTVEECDADEKVSDIVPIAVGVALALLIIIVLIAYLVGRRRSRQKGYQSV